MHTVRILALLGLVATAMCASCPMSDATTGGTVTSGAHTLTADVCDAAYDTDGCCLAAQTDDIKKQRDSLMKTTFGEGECLKAQTSFVCGFTCSPKQSEWVTITNSGAGGSRVAFTLKVCKSACQNAYDACKSQSIAGQSYQSLAGGSATTFCKDFMVDSTGEQTKNQNPPPPIVTVEIVEDGQGACLDTIAVPAAEGNGAGVVGVSVAAALVAAAAVLAVLLG